MTPTRAPRGTSTLPVVLIGTMLIATSLTAACKSGPPAAPPVPANAWATVDGRTITREDVDKAYRRSNDGTQTPAPEELLTAKLSLLNDLILQDILLAKAATLKLEVPAADLDTAYANARKDIPDDAFQQELSKRGLTPADMREVLRRELLVQKLIEQEVGSKVTVTDAEVSAFYDANKAQFNVPEESYHLAQIVVTPARDTQVANASGDDAVTPQAAAAKVQMLMERLKGGASFRELAIAFSEDPASSARGGDLGLVGVSRLMQAPPQLRNAVLNKTPGTVSVASADGAHTLVLVVSHEQAGQRDLSTPGVKERITEGLKARRVQLLQAAYVTAARSDAAVVNHQARRVIEAKGLVPAEAAAPAATK